MASAGSCAAVWVPPAGGAAAGDLSLCFQEAVLFLPLELLVVLAVLLRFVVRRNFGPSSYDAAPWRSHAAHLAAAAAAAAARARAARDAKKTAGTRRNETATAPLDAREAGGANEPDEPAAAAAAGGGAAPRLRPRRRDVASYAVASLAVAAALARAIVSTVEYEAAGGDSGAAEVSLVEAWVGFLAFAGAAAVQVRSAARREPTGETVPLLFWAAWAVLAAVKTRSLVLTGTGGDLALITFTLAWAGALAALVVEAWPHRGGCRRHRRRTNTAAKAKNAGGVAGTNIQQDEQDELGAAKDDVHSDDGSDDDSDDDGVPRVPSGALARKPSGSGRGGGSTLTADERTPLLPAAPDAAAAGAAAPETPPAARRPRPRSAYDTANVYSRMLFYWLGGLISRGRRQGKIEAADIPELPSILRAEVDVYTVVSAWRQETERVDAAAKAAAELAASMDPAHRRPSEDPARGTPSLRRALWRAFRWQFLGAAPFRLGQDILAFAQPLLLEQLMLVIEDGGATGIPPARGYLIAAGMFAAAAGQTILSQQYFNLCFETAAHIRAGIVGLLFAKSLRQANHARLARTTGETVNHMSIDAQRVGDVANFAHNMWSSPLQILIALALLYTLIKGAVFAGLAVLLLLTPLDVVLSRRLKAGQKSHMKNKDTRMKVVDELLQGIKMVKLYAWESIFLERLSTARTTETASLRQLFIRLTLQTVLWASGPTLVTVASLGTFVAVYDQPLTPTIAFVSLTLFALLQAPLAALPATIAAVIDGNVAVGRLTSYLDTPEHETSPADWGLPPTPPDPAALSRRRGRQQPRDPYEDAVAQVIAETTPHGGVLTALLAKSTDTGGGDGGSGGGGLALPPALAGWMGMPEAASLVKPTTSAYVRAEAPPRGTHGPAGRVAIYSGRFFWYPPDKTAELHSGKAAPVLDDITLELPPGGLTAVVGGVGSGKSALIAALLGEICRDDGIVTMVGRVAYVPQQAWILNATVRDNILFGLPFDAARYRDVVAACALDADLAVLPAGDDTEIGERGINLSGGQRQRVSLARAVYARADVYLLDDPLSAVDAHVSRHLFERVLGPQGLLRSATRVLITHDLAVLPSADWIVALRAGRIAEQGTWAKLTSVVATRAGAAAGPATARHLEQAAAAAVTAGQVAPPPPVESLAALAAVFDIKTFKPEARTDPADVVVDAPTVPQADPKRARAAAGASAGKLMRREVVHTGAVATAVYRTYTAAIGWRSVAMLVALLAAAQTALVGASLWLQYWASDPDNASELALYLGVYALLSLVQVFLVGASSAVASIVCGLGAAQRLFDGLVDHVVHATMAFFDTTPAGRTLNRFSKDVDSVDLNLPRAANNMLRATFTLLGILVAIAVATPIFAVAILPLLVVVYALQQYFLVAKRDLKRLDSAARSPVIAHFAEVLQGIASLRAYGQQARFRAENMARLEDHQRAFYYSITCNRWLAVRLELLGAVTVLIAATLAVGLLGPANAALAGLSVSFALQITTALSTLSRTWAEVESHIIAVERIVEYEHVPREAPLILPDRRAPVGWPSGGAVALVAYSTRYRPELELVLRDVSFSVRAAEKVGVVGRTGSGKSSLLLAITRILEPAAGRIEIDGLNVGPGQLGLTDLRSHVVVVPQDPILFSGTVRTNLDPWRQHSDERLWWALTSVQLEALVKDFPLGLDHPIVQGGANLSAGQRQLLCLGRALLLRARLLLLDEATSSVDVETDRRIQAMLRATFTDTTVVTIAHRIHTILDSDRVIVLDQGAVLECDRPETLLEQPDSAFAKLVASSQRAL